MVESSRNIVLSVPRERERPPFSPPKKPVHHACPTIAPREEDARRDSVWESTHRSLLPTEFIKLFFFFLAKMASISFIIFLPPLKPKTDTF